jgi:hypothetical protein
LIDFRRPFNGLPRQLVKNHETGPWSVCIVLRQARCKGWTPILRANFREADGGHAVTARPSKIYLGSKKRVQRVTLRGNWSHEMWIVIAVLLFTLLVVVPWMIRHAPPA